MKVNLLALPLLILLFLASCEDTASRINQGRTFLDEGKPGEAAKVLEDLETDNEKFADAYLLKGAAYYQLELYQKASIAFRAYLTLRPEDYKGHFNLGNSLLMQEEINPAIAAYLKALDLRDTSEVRNNLALLYNRTGQFAEAAEVLQPIAEQDFPPLEVIYNYASALLGNKEYQKSYQQFSRVLELDSTLSGAWYGAGICLLMNNQRDEGCQTIFKAKLLGHSPIRPQIIEICGDYFGGLLPESPTSGTIQAQRTPPDTLKEMTEKQTDTLDPLDRIRFIE